MNERSASPRRSVSRLESAVPAVPWTRLADGDVPWSLEPQLVEASSAFLSALDAADSSGDTGPPVIEALVVENLVVELETFATVRWRIVHSDDSRFSRCQLDRPDDAVLLVIVTDGGAICHLTVPDGLGGRTAAAAGLAVRSGQCIVVPPAWGLWLGGWECRSQRIEIAFSPRLGAGHSAPATA